ncbi:hypothetical protein Taro_001720 [Colocasia esculenta]|uniref:Uncharacterized protein n=1 Tax=Colocasia esculenta TaxID=4460 RepID=A0A843TH13_COLES|nr:hypothetical protein [Colocasia esculenta]
MFFDEEVLQMLELRSLDGIRWRFSSIDDTLLLWHLKHQKSFFYCSSSVGSASFPSIANFSPEIPLDSHVLPLERMACSFWRWSQIWKTTFFREKAYSGSVWALPFFVAQESWSQCVDTQEDCVDTTGYYFRIGFWDSELVSTHRTVGCFPGEGCSQDFYGLVSAGCCASSWLRYATVVLVVAFWWVFPEWRLGGSGGGFPRTSYVASTVCCVLSVGQLFGIGSSDGFQIGSWRFGWRFPPLAALCCFVCRCSLTLWR